MFIELTRITKRQIRGNTKNDGTCEVYYEIITSKAYINIFRIVYIEPAKEDNKGTYIELMDNCFWVEEPYDVVKNMISFASRENHSL